MKTKIKIALLSALIGIVIGVVLVRAAAGAGDSAATGWYCTSQDGTCHATHEECATHDSDGSGQDAPTCRWVRHAYVSVLEYENSHIRYAFETRQICDRWRSWMRRRNLRGTDTTSCRYRGVQ